MNDDRPPYDFGEALKAWTRIPIDDFDYMTPDELLRLHSDQVIGLARLAYQIRFDPGMWRNRGNSLVDFMALPKWDGGKYVVDYGCGLGLDSQRFAMGGAQPIMVDLHPKGLFLAHKLMAAMTGFIAKRLSLATDNPPFLPVDLTFDLFWSMGVLHHTPLIGHILREACDKLKPNGECRICLYSDKRWRDLTGETETPTGPTWKHPKYLTYVRACDTVGHYADWYDAAKIAGVVKGFADVVECRYLCEGQMIGAVIKPKGK